MKALPINSSNSKSWNKAFTPLSWFLCSIQGLSLHSWSRGYSVPSPCYVYAEKTLSHDAVGLRVGVLTLDDTKAIEESRLFFAGAKKSVDCLAMAG